VSADTVTKIRTTVRIKIRSSVCWYSY